MTLKKFNPRVFSVLFFFFPLIFWSQTVSITDIKLFFIKETLLLTLVIWLGAVFWRKKVFLAWHSVVSTIIVYLLWQLFTFLISEFSDPGVLSAQIFGCLLPVFLITSGFSRQDLKLPAIALTCSALLVSVYMISDHFELFFINSLRQFSENAGSSTMGHKNFASAFLLLALPLPIFFSIPLKKTTDKAGLLAAAVIIFWALILTQSRGAIGALAVSALALTVVKFRPKKLKETGKLIGLALGILVFAWAVMPGDLKVSFTDSASSPEKAFKMRTDFYTSAIDLIRESPVYGHGTGSFFHLYPEFKKKYALGFLPRGVYIKHVHNEYLEMVTDGGLIQLLIFVVIIILFYLALFRRRNEVWFSSVFISSTAYLVFSLVTVAPRYLFVSITFWGILSIPFMDPKGRNLDLSGVRRFLTVPLAILLLWAGAAVSRNFWQQRLQNRAWERFNRGERIMAAAAMNSLAEGKKNDPGLFYQKGMMLLRMKEFGSAEKAFRKTIGFSPNYMEAHYYLALTLKGQKRFEAGISEMKKSFSVNMNRSADWHLNFAEMEYYTRRWKEALGTLGWIEKNYPPHKKALFLKNFIEKKLAAADSSSPRNPAIRIPRN